jgi:transcriptional regulator with XRE-family HTH domain
MFKFGITKNPIDLLNEIASKHRIIRKSFGLSQSELAEKSGVSLGSLKRFERTGHISLQSLLMLSHVLNRLEDFDLIFKPKENLDEIEKLFSDKTRKS